MHRSFLRPLTLGVAAALLVPTSPLPAYAIGARSTPPGAEVPGQLPVIAADAYVLADYATGRVLAEKAPHARLRPASTQKILTALALLPVLNPSTVHIAVPDDVASLAVAEPGASAVGIRPGIAYRVSDLWNGVFLRSGNDAIATLIALAGGLPKALALIRATAARLHATDTTIVNADGYDADGQLSSAYDLALMARAGLADPAFRSYCSLPHARMPSKNGSTFEIDNENRLLGRYAGMIGVKNGYTTLARHTFVGAARRGGRTLIVTMLGAGQDIYQQTAKLLDWGFAAPNAGANTDSNVGTNVGTGTDASAGAGPGATAAGARADTLAASDPLPAGLVPTAAADDAALEPVEPLTSAQAQARAASQATAAHVAVSGGRHSFTDVTLAPLAVGLGLGGLLIAALIALRVRAVVKIRRRTNPPSPGPTKA